MTKVNFADNRKKAEEAGLLGGGNYFKLQEGVNKIRLMSECVEHPGEYNGKPTFKWLCHVLDRRDGKIKPFFMAHTIYKQIEAFQLDSEYAFDEVPMPYDITINAVNAGDITAKYTVVPARQNAALTPAERALLTGTQPIRELQAALYEKQPAAAAPVDPVHDDGPPIDVEMPA